MPCYIKQLHELKCLYQPFRQAHQQTVRKKSSPGQFLSLSNIIIFCSARVSFFVTGTASLPMGSGWRQTTDINKEVLASQDDPSLVSSRFLLAPGLGGCKAVRCRCWADKKTWPCCNFLIFFMNHTAQPINKHLSRAQLSCFFKPTLEPLCHSEGMNIMWQ